jgi:hypothetical protein
LGALAQCRGTKLIGARKLSRYIGFILCVMARVRVQQRLEMLHVPADCEMTIIDQKEKKSSG